MIKCSFCGKSSQEVEAIIAAPNCYICNVCVEICRDIIGAKRNRVIKPVIESIDAEITNKTDIEGMRDE